MEEAIGEAGFKGIRKFITRRHKTVAQYIATRPIMDLCDYSTWQTRARVSWKWWEQAGIDLEGGNKRVAEAAESATYSKPYSDSGGKESNGASESSGA